MGVDLACLIDALIKQLNLPRDIAIVAWSLGNVFLVSLLASVDSLPTDVRKSLTTSVKHVILWGTSLCYPGFEMTCSKYFLSSDPPSESLGLPLPPGGYIPLYDTELSPEECLAKFGIWVSSVVTLQSSTTHYVFIKVASYWKHGNLASHDPSQLNYRTPEKEPPPTSETLGEELFALADLTAGEKSDTSILQVHNHNVLSKLWDKALFDASVREAWAGSKFTHFYGDASTWNIIYTGWFLEDKVKSAATEKLLVHFKVVKGANHFVSVDQPFSEVELIIISSGNVGQPGRRTQ